MFVLVNIGSYPVSMNVKCDPEQALEYRERYESVKPGYHMNKKYWNTVSLDGSIPEFEILKMIDHSYEQVVKGFARAVQSELLVHEVVKT